MDKIEMVDCLDEVSSKLKGIISLANMRLNDLNNPNGSLSSEDIQSILYVTIELLSYQYKDIRNVRDQLLLMEKKWLLSSKGMQVHPFFYVF